MKQVGQLNRRPVFHNYTYLQDEAGGTKKLLLEEWQQWAEIIDTSGSAFNIQSQQVQSADVKVTVRFDRKFKATTEMLYEGMY